MHDYLFEKYFYLLNFNPLIYKIHYFEKMLLSGIKQKQSTLDKDIFSI